MNHKLKIEPNYLENIISGKKTAEVRFNDRDYQVGDTLEFTQYLDPESFKNWSFKITHIHSGLGLKEGYVVLSIRIV